MNGHNQKPTKPKHTKAEVKIVRGLGNELILEIAGSAAGCLDSIGEDDPAVLLSWTHNQVAAAVAKANRDLIQLPHWMTSLGDGFNAYPIQEDKFKEAVIRWIASAGSGQTVDICVAAPNTLEEYSFIRDFLNHLMTDPFIVHICQTPECRPLARVYVLYDNKRKTTAVPCPMSRIPQGCNWVQAFM